MIRKIYFFSIFWTVIVCVLSNLPGNSINNVGFKIPHLDKIVHLGMYFILSFVVMLDIALRSKVIKKHFIFSFFYSFILGILMEMTQHFFAVSRQADIFDVLFNSIGSLLGILAFRIINLFFNKRIVSSQE